MELTQLSKADLLQAISESADCGVLLSALHKTAADQAVGKAPRNQVPALFQAKLRGMAAMRQLLEVRKVGLRETRQITVRPEAPPAVGAYSQHVRFWLSRRLAFI